MTAIIVMAGLDPATQPARIARRNDSLALADARALDGVATLSLATKGGHDELSVGLT